MVAATHREIFSESCQSKPNLDRNYHFPIDLAPIGNPIGAKSISKGQLQSKFGSDLKDSKNISRCVFCAFPRVFHLHLLDQ